MEKIIKEYGSSKIILLTTEECEIHKIKVGDIVNIEITKFKEEKK